MLNLVLFGPPGAGKGTQAQYLVDHYNLIHLSTGDLLRREIATQSDLGIEAKEYIDRGELVPDSVVIGMIRTKLKEDPAVNGYVFDGFPRTVKQAKALDCLLKANKTPVSAMLSLEVAEEELIIRLLKRGEVSNRSDDRDMGVIKNRIAVYHFKTRPLIDHYLKQSKYHSINGMGGVEAIAERLRVVVDQL